jgi:hypothetical protein
VHRARLQNEIFCVYRSCLQRGFDLLCWAGTK